MPIILSMLALLKPIKRSLTALEQWSQVIRLFIRNGVYRGEPRDFINPNEGGAQPPSGTATAFTTVMGEDPGQVILDGEDRLSVVSEAFW